MIKYTMVFAVFTEHHNPLALSEIISEDFMTGWSIHSMVGLELEEARCFLNPRGTITLSSYIILSINYVIFLINFSINLYLTRVSSRCYIKQLYITPFNLSIFMLHRMTTGIATRLLNYWSRFSLDFLKYYFKFAK